MKKRILAALLAAVIILTLAGCANSNTDAPTPETTGQTVSAKTTKAAESDTDTEHTEEKKNSTAEETKPAETTPPQTKPTEPPKTEQPKATEPAVTEPPKVTEPPAQTQQPEVTEPEKESFTEADHKRIIAEVTAYANSYANKGFTFEWKESMTFGWDVGYMGTPRVKYEGVDGVIETLKYHIDLIYKTSTDPMYGITTEYMTYKVEQITVDGDLAYAVIYGG